MNLKPALLIYATQANTWVRVTIDHDMYVHYPFYKPGSDKQLAIDCQYVPIALSDFCKMSAFGDQRLRTENLWVFVPQL
ncbi:hypothetical protein CWC17_13565 [Pseudoalteromonas sp. S3785]|nr:hypothetical protein CWC17_13565 [Pseudoalteromonas sp. S3785]